MLHVHLVLLLAIGRTKPSQPRNIALNLWLVSADGKIEMSIDVILHLPMLSLVHTAYKVTQRLRSFAWVYSYSGGLAADKCSAKLSGLGPRPPNLELMLGGNPNG